MKLQLRVAINHICCHRWCQTKFHNILNSFKKFIPFMFQFTEWKAKAVPWDNQVIPKVYVCKIGILYFLSLKSSLFSSKIIFRRNPHLCRLGQFPRLTSHLPYLSTSFWLTDHLWTWQKSSMGKKVLRADAWESIIAGSR